MSHLRHDDRRARKYVDGSRDLHREIAEERRSGSAQIKLCQPNRDRWRGDSDRTGDHQDAVSAAERDAEDGNARYDRALDEEDTDDES